MFSSCLPCPCGSVRVTVYHKQLPDGVHMIAQCDKCGKSSEWHLSERATIRDWNENVAGEGEKE
jgi:hypothetical protein